MNPKNIKLKCTNGLYYVLRLRWCDKANGLRWIRASDLFTDRTQAENYYKMILTNN